LEVPSSSSRINQLLLSLAVNLRETANSCMPDMITTLCSEMLSLN
jgi:hypothetical protein